LGQLSKIVRNFCNHEEGSIITTAAILIPMLFIAGGMALDIANTASIKERLQSSADSVSLVVATRMASGDLSVHDADQFAQSLFSAQMATFNDRYTELDYSSEINATETIDGSVTTWNVVIQATANIQTTSLSSLIGRDRMNVTINSGSTTSNEEVQGAFSMVIVVDVSGSMYWPTDQAIAMQSILSEDRGDASRVSANLYDAYHVYGLSEAQIQFIIGNYDVDDCEDVTTSNSDRVAFLNSIGISPSTDSQTAYSYCYGPAYAAEKGGAQNILDNWDAVFANIDASKLRLLKTAASTMLSQMQVADPGQEYVRTGSVSYQSYKVSDTELEWGVNHTNGFIEGLSAGGGTSSTDAMDWAYDSLKTSDGTEITAHQVKNGQVPDRFIVFMTDGSNNYSSDDVATKNICDQAKNDGISIFSVAFAAPSGGQALLNYCATSSDYYFEPETADQLVDVFEYIGSHSTKTLTRLTN
jgi:Flp pilus assembly protein TadG